MRLFGIVDEIGRLLMIDSDADELRALLMDGWTIREIA